MDWEVAAILVPFFVVTEYLPTICFINRVEEYSKFFYEDRR